MTEQKSSMRQHNTTQVQHKKTQVKQVYNMTQHETTQVKHETL